MADQGTVCGYSATGQRFAIRTPCGYSVVDVEIGELRVHDKVIGNLVREGLATLYNATSGEPVEVCVEAVHATQEAAESLLRRR